MASHNDFADFVQAVLQDYEGSGQVEWENATVTRLLDALAAVSWSRVVEQDGQETPTWRLFAEMVVAATGYE